MSDLKYFVFDSTPTVVEEGVVGDASQEEAENRIVTHNQGSPGDKRCLILGHSFPPAGFRWDSTAKEFVEKTLSEKVADGDVVIPSGYKLVGNSFVAMTLTELQANNALRLRPFEKISDDGLSVVQKTEDELFQEGAIGLSVVAERARLRIREDADKVIQVVQKKFPDSESQLFQIKSDQATDWMALDGAQKTAAMGDELEIIRFKLLVTESEANPANPADAVVKIDELAGKILQKSGILSNIFGTCMSLAEQAEDTIAAAVTNNDYTALLAVQGSIVWPDPETAG